MAISPQPSSSVEPMEYFRDDPAWDTVFHAVSRRLAELGRVGGTITLTDAGATQAVERVGCPVKRGRVNLVRLDAELRAGRYPDGLWATVERYFGREIAVNAEVRAKAEASWAAAQAKWRDEIATAVNTRQLEMDEAQRIYAWLDKNAGTFRRAWNQQSSETARSLVIAVRSAVAAPGRTQDRCALPVFALRQTGDPHGFDQDRQVGRYLLSALAARFLNNPARARSDALERELVLAAAGLSSDGISSVVACAGLEGDHPVLAAARSTGDILALPVITVQSLERVTGYAGQAFVVENPAVFVSLWRRLSGTERHRLPTLVCSSGELSLAALLLLDRLVDAGTTLLYSGDFDGKGLEIAARLVRRYGATACRLWRMDLEDYALALAARRDLVTQTIIPNLDEIPAALRECIAERGSASQEALIDVLAADMRNSRAATDAPPTAPRLTSTS
jgi:uncharacterized protein (TIGR02679 family)